MRSVCLRPSLRDILGSHTPLNRARPSLSPGIPHSSIFMPRLFLRSVLGRASIGGALQGGARVLTPRLTFLKNIPKAPLEIQGTHDILGSFAGRRPTSQVIPPLNLHWYPTGSSTAPALRSRNPPRRTAVPWLKHRCGGFFRCRHPGCARCTRVGGACTDIVVRAV